MGKCIECKLRDASYCDPGGGERRWCKGCVAELQNGAISRYQALKTTSAPKRRADSGHVPLSLAAQPDTPDIVANLGPKVLEDQNSAVADVLQNGAIPAL